MTRIFKKRAWLVGIILETYEHCEQYIMLLLRESNLSKPNLVATCRYTTEIIEHRNMNFNSFTVANDYNFGAQWPKGGRRRFF